MSRMKSMVLGYVRDYQNNFVPELQLNTVSIKEDMNPLIRIRRYLGKQPDYPG